MAIRGGRRNTDWQAIKFWEKSKPLSIPQEVQDVFESQFEVEPQHVESWRMLETFASNSGEKVRRIRVFDTRALIGEKPRNYDGLLKDSIPFEGRIEAGCAVSPFDQRRRKLEPTY